MDEIGEITDYIQEQAGRTADIIWGNCTDETLSDKLSVTLIATGFKTSVEQGQEVVRNTKKVHTLDGPVQSQKSRPNRHGMKPTNPFCWHPTACLQQRG
jgi:cell division protein FtsZ